MRASRLSDALERTRGDARTRTPCRRRPTHALGVDAVFDAIRESAGGMRRSVASDPFNESRPPRRTAWPDLPPGCPFCQVRPGNNLCVSREGKFSEGGTVSFRELVAIDGESVPVPDAGRLVHLQLRRFAGCPICNVHLRSMAARHEEIVAAGIREVVVFHSHRDELRSNQAPLPFALIADPERRLYREFGVQTSARAVLDPRAWSTIGRGLSGAVRRAARRQAPPPPLHAHGGKLGLPGDFLIDTDGRVVACKYGTHAGDQWSVDELLEIAAHHEPGGNSHANRDSALSPLHGARRGRAL